MSRDRRVFELFQMALERPADERTDFLRAECAEDVDLLREVEALLKSDENFAAGGQLPPILRGPDVDENAGQFLGVQNTEDLGAITLGTPGGDTETLTHTRSYRLLGKLGEGGMGVVYEAEQREPVRRKVALKLIKWGMDTKEVIARFDSERQALALMNHPNIASIYDAGATEKGRPCFAMEYVQGIPITDYCDKHRLTIRERLELFIQVCEGVQHAHQKGVIHRDLKPSNVLVVVQDDKPLPKIIDFGVAKATSQRLTEHTVYTEHGRLIGTPEYMSPEQAEMTNLDIDTRTDVYSLGVIFYELLAGARPFDAATLRERGYTEIQRVLREEEPPKPSTRVSTLGEDSGVVAKHRSTDTPRLTRQLRGEIDWIVLKAMEKDRTRRYETANALSEDIGRFLRDEPVVAGPPSAVYRLRKAAKRNRVPLAFGLTVLLLLTLALVGSFREQARIREARDDLELVVASLEDILSAADPSRLGRDATVHEVLDEATSTMGEKFKGQPRVEARLRFTAGKTYEALGEYEAAESNLEQAIEIEGRVLGERHPETLRSVEELGIVYLGQGRYEDAEALHSKTLEDRRRVLGEEDPETLKSMGNLANAQWKQGRYEEAKALHREALEIHRRVLGEEHPQTLTSMSSLAVVYSDEGLYDQAEALLLESLEIRRRVLGEEHLDTARSMHNLALVFARQGRYDEAEALQRETLGIHTRALGEEHPNTLASMNTLAGMLWYQGRYAESAALFKENLEIKRRVLGEEHPETLQTMNNLGIAYWQQERYDEAEALHRETLEIRRRVLGEEHPETAQSMINLGIVYRDQRRYEEADAIYQETLEIQRRVLGKEHPETARAMQNLAGVYWDQGRHEEAGALYKETLEIQRRLLGEEHTEMLQTKSSLARVYAAQERHVEAESLYVETLATARRVLGEKHSLTHDVVYRLACLMVVQGRRDQALAYLRQALEFGFVGDKILDDPDLVSLHGDPQFETIVAEVKKRRIEEE